jgi:hypothetical protein
MDRLQRFLYGGSELVTTLPARAWVPGEEAVGTRRITATGVGAGEIIRTDTRLHMTLRFYESEWPDVVALIEYGLTSDLVEWFPEADDPGTSFQVYLDSPEPSEDWGPTRTDFERVMEIELVWRGAFGAEPWAEYFTT